MSGPAPEPGRGGSLRARGTALRERLRESALAQGTWFMFLGLGCRSLLQAAYFVIIARALSVDGYGAFLGVVALVAVAAPFSSLGAGQLLIQDVSRDPQLFAKRWGNALVVTAASGLGLSAVVIAASRLILPSSIPVRLVVMVALADLICARLTDVASQAYWAFGQMRRTATLTVWLGAVRLVAALALVGLVPVPTPVHWGVGYLLSAATVAAAAVYVVHREFGPPDFAGAGARTTLREGFFFSIGQSACSVYSEIDKTMLTRLSTLYAAGVYGAAYRVLDVAFAPIMSLLMASYTRFFRSGGTGVAGTLVVARKLLPTGAAAGALTGIALFACAPVVPLVLGPEYAETVWAIRWLALLPLLRAIQFIGADTLTGAGHQALRSGVYVGTAIFNVLLNLWTIPRFGWRGAAWSTLATEVLVTAVVWSAVFRLYHRQRGVVRNAAVLLPEAG